jgi:hypothetical protein
MTRETETDGVELPRPTSWPLALAVGVTMLAAGVAMNLFFSVVGLLLVIISLGGWIRELLGGRGEVREALVEPSRRPRPIVGVPGRVELLRPGTPGYRFRMPEKVHPLSTGIRGGIIGGLMMSLAAILYGLVSGHGIWFPVNLLAGMVLPGISGASVEELEQFRPGALVLGIVIHAAFSLVFGMMLGVVLPTMPQLPGGQLFWVGVLPPLFWSVISYALMGIVNPLLQIHVNWPWFIASQFVFGLTAAVVVMSSQKVPIPPVGTGPSENTSAGGNP